MSSRTPAPDDFGHMPMPDLPGDFFEDDSPIYAPVDRTQLAYGYEQGDAWGDDYPDDGGFPGHNQTDGYIEEPPRRAPRRSGDVDVRSPGRQRSVPAYEEYDEFEIDRPRRRERRVPRDEGFGEIHPRRRQRRERRDDEYMAATRQEEPARERVPERQVRREPSRRRPANGPRQDRVIEAPRMQAEAATADIITSILPSTRPAPRPRPRKTRNPAWQWESIIMPQPRQVLVQILPSWLMAASILGTLAILGFLPGGLPLWAPLILLPTLILLFRADPQVHPVWGRSAIVNLVVVGAFFPLMIVRQSFLRVPFVEYGNGTLVMPVLSTVLVVLGMTAIALGSAYLSQEDPEYAGMLFLPAALLVPFFAGATEITGLGTALAIMGSIYVVNGILTVVASMMPAAFPTLVAPIALAIEFFILPVSESTPIFPVGAGMSAKLLFFIVLAVGVGLTVAVPMMAVWVRQVRRIVFGATSGATTAAAA